MPSLIQRQANGLLILLNSRSSGQAPNTLLDEVRGVIDLAPFYGADRRTDRNSQIAGADIIAGGVGIYEVAANSSLRVSPGSVRVVHYLSARMIAGAGGTNFAFSVGWRSFRDLTNPTWVRHGDRAVAPPAAGLASAGGCMPRPFLQTPLEVPAILVESGSANAATIQVDMIFDRLDPESD